MKHPVVAILEDLVAIQSVNPALADGARGERELSQYIEARCTRNGLKVTRQAVLPGRG